MAPAAVKCLRPGRRVRSALGTTTAAAATGVTGHEVGHNAGRNHPTPAGDDLRNTEVREGCGHSRSDNSFLRHAAIGNGSMWGFDVGDVGLEHALTPRLSQQHVARTTMSYCDNQWISDYTLRRHLQLPQQRHGSRHEHGAGTCTPDALHRALSARSTPKTPSAPSTSWVCGTAPGPLCAPTSGPSAWSSWTAAAANFAGYDFDGEPRTPIPPTLPTKWLCSSAGHPADSHGAHR